MIYETLFCRLKSAPSRLVKRLLITRSGYTLTESLDEVQFTTDFEGVLELVKSYPELEVCCLDAEPTIISVEGPRGNSTTTGSSTEVRHASVSSKHLNLSGS